jgi:hypothetical protein
LEVPFCSVNLLLRNNSFPYWKGVSADADRSAQMAA